MPEIIDNSSDSRILLNGFMLDSKDIEKISILSAFCSFGAFVDIANNSLARESFLRCDVQIIIGLSIDYKTYKMYEEVKVNTLEDLLEYAKQEKDSNEETIEVLKLFKEKCENNTLEIRQAKKPIHAKLYLFRNDTISDGGNRYIIGSSNFTHQGLKGQRELNIKGYESKVELIKQEQTEYKKYKTKMTEWFDKEWEDSTTLLNYKNEKEFFVKLLPELYNDINENTYNNIEESNDIIDNINTEENMITPYNLYLKTIYEYFSSLENESLSYTPKQFGFTDYKYQLDAIRSGILSIRTYGGVLVSDVVGLGKSIIASSIAINLLNANFVQNIIILSPPKIMDSWESYSRDFDLKAKVISIGKLQDALKYKNKNNLIIIDEAHRFINNKTKSYEEIKAICFNNKVMLLTATPMHNTTSDIFNLIDIFDNILIRDENIDSIRKSIIKEEQKLKLDYKKDSDKDYKDATQNISRKIIGLINPLIIRRTRKDLLENALYKKDLLEQDTEFNNVSGPMLHSYDLEELLYLYVNTFEQIKPLKYEEGRGHLKCVRYEPLAYLTPSKEANEVIKKIYGENINIDFASTSSKNLAGFMRHLLIRRFESSIYAFKKTIDNMIDRYKYIERYISCGIYFIDKKSNFNLIDEFLFSNDDDFDDDNSNMIIEFEKKIDSYFKNQNSTICVYEDCYIIRNIDRVFRGEFFTELKNDLRVLESIRDEWKDIDVQDDRKFKKLIEELKTFIAENSERKIIIFSEFRDTVEYLYENISKDDSLRELFKPIKFTSQNRDRETIRANFDASYKYQENKYFLLITTDTLSEGINLHRAGIVINYDIPYNPTRVIQRVGRINRIGKKLFDRIEIHNFIPRVDAQEEIKNWQIANFKLSLINAIFGNDTKILKSDEDIKAVLDIKNQNEFLDSEESSWDSEYRNDYDMIKNDHNLLQSICSIKDNVAIRRESDINGLVKIIKKNDYIFSVCFEGSGIINYNIDYAFKLLKPKDKNERCFEVSNKLDYYEYQINRRTANNSNSINIEILKDLFDYIKLQNDNGNYTKDIEYINLIIENKNKLSLYASRINACFKARGGDAFSIIKSLKKVITFDELVALCSRECMDDDNTEVVILREEFFKRDY